MNGLCLGGTVLPREAEPQTGRTGREEALLAELIQGLAGLAQHGLGGRQVPGKQLDAEALLGAPGGKNRKSELAEHRYTLLPASARLVEASRECKEWSRLGAGDGFDLLRRGLLEDIVATRERLTCRGRPVPRADQVPDQELRLVATAARVPGANEAPRKRLVGVARPPEPELGHPDDQPRPCQPEVVSMPLEDRNCIPHDVAPGDDPEVFDPQLDGDEAHAGPPLDDLLPGCARLGDNRCKDRPGSLQLTPVEQSGGELDLHLALRRTLLRDKARRALEQRDRGGCVAATRRPPTGGPQASGGARGVLRALVDVSELGRVSVSLLEVVAEDLVELDELSATLREPLREAPVELGTRRLRKRLVSGVPNQEMPEPEPVVPRQLCPVGTDQVFAGQ